MPVPNLRRSVRAVILDEKVCVLLCRFDLPARGVVLWATPGGGMEDGESPLTTLRRELDEEVGLALIAEPPHIWHQRVVAEGHAQGYDGVVNDYYLVNTDNFIPGGSLGAEMLRAENITRFRWWSLGELRAYRGHAIFAPRDLAALLAKLTRLGPPAEPLTIGL